MYRLFPGIALAGAMLVASPGSAVESANQPVLLKKQMTGCMAKRMLANRGISYNDAKKACADQLKGQSDGIALNRAPGALTAASSQQLAR